MCWLFLIFLGCRDNLFTICSLCRYEDYIAISGIHWVDYLCYHRYTFITFLVLIITSIYGWKRRISSVDVSVVNTTVFADKYPPPLKHSPNHTLNTSFNESLSPKRSPESPLRPFSAFVPVYGDPRGFYTPNGRRRVSLNPTIWGGDILVIIGGSVSRANLLPCTHDIRGVSGKRITHDKLYYFIT